MFFCTLPQTGLAVPRTIWFTLRGTVCFETHCPVAEGKTVGSNALWRYMMAAMNALWISQFCENASIFSSLTIHYMHHLYDIYHACTICFYIYDIYHAICFFSATVCFETHIIHPWGCIRKYNALTWLTLAHTMDHSVPILCKLFVTFLEAASACVAWKSVSINMVWYRLQSIKLHSRGYNVYTLRCVSAQSSC